MVLQCEQNANPKALRVFLNRTCRSTRLPLSITVRLISLEGLIREKSDILKRKHILRYFLLVSGNPENCGLKLT